MKNTTNLMQGDCLEKLKDLADNSVDSIVTVSMERQSVCGFCDKSFEVLPSRKHHGRGKYCSKECKYAGSRKDNIKQCELCKKEFRYTNKKQRFCTSDCSYKAKSVGLVTRKVLIPYKTKPISEWRKRKCCICDIDYIATKRTQSHCSKACHYITQSNLIAGEKNYFYKDGSSKEKRCYRGDDWGVIRKSIYKRDGWSCRYCGKHCDKREIQCHHITPYRLTKDNSENNLVTLCVSCHPKIERNIERFDKGFFQNYIAGQIELDPDYFEIAKARIENAKLLNSKYII